MGLDMYAYTTTRRRLRCEIDFPVREADEQIHRWRKHPNLHGWMEQLYCDKGGDDAFNCATVLLTSVDIDDLEKDIQRKKLPPTSGFFFGQSTGDERVDDLAFITKARAAIASGLQVYYYAWW